MEGPTSELLKFDKIPIENKPLRVHYRPDKVVETVRGEAWVRHGASKRKLMPQSRSPRKVRSCAPRHRTRLRPIVTDSVTRLRRLIFRRLLFFGGRFSQD